MPDKSGNKTRLDRINHGSLEDGDIEAAIKFYGS